MLPLSWKLLLGHVVVRQDGASNSFPQPALEIFAGALQPFFWESPCCPDALQTQLSCGFHVLLPPP